MAGSLLRLRAARWRGRSGQHSQRLRSDDGGTVVVHGARIVRRLPALGHAVITNDLGDTQPIIRKNLRSPRRLHLPVLLTIAPGRDRILVAPDGKREELARIGKALEAFDRDESVGGIEIGASAAASAR